MEMIVFTAKAAKVLKGVFKEEIDPKNQRIMIKKLDLILVKLVWSTTS